MEAATRGGRHRKAVNTRLTAAGARDREAPLAVSHPWRLSGKGRTEATQVLLELFIETICAIDAQAIWLPYRNDIGALLMAPFN
jgi:hypothetical protein